MITEDYVSFEVAKLLKEKGFDWEWSPFYSEQDRDEWAKNNNYNIPNANYDANIPFDSETLNIIAPHVSLQMALKWLREVHNICIVIQPYDSYYKERYEFEINKKNNDDFTWEWISDIENTIFNTYEQTVEAAIKYCLTNLIK